MKLFLGIMIFAIPALGADFPIYTSSEAVFPDVDFDGSAYLVVWRKDCYNWGRRVNSAGSTVGGTFEISLNEEVNSPMRPTVGWADTNWLVTWSSNRAGQTYQIYGEIISSAGERVTEVEIDLSSSNDNTQIASDGTKFLVVYDEGDIQYRIVESDGTLATPISAIARDSLQQAPNVAWGGDKYFVAWHERKGSEYDIWGQLVSSTGSLIGGSIEICTGPGNQRYPDICWDGTC